MYIFTVAVIFIGACVFAIRCRHFHIQPFLSEEIVLRMSDSCHVILGKFPFVAGDPAHLGSTVEGLIAWRTSWPMSG